jgi:hypothetical protein
MTSDRDVMMGHTRLTELFNHTLRGNMIGNLARTIIGISLGLVLYLRTDTEVTMESHKTVRLSA